MKPIKWRKYKSTDLARFATVEGVDLLLWRSGTDSGPEIVADDIAHGITLHKGVNRMQIDAAAYALADLVATLRGFE